jgi:hypothetical protein
MSLGIVGIGLVLLGILAFAIWNTMHDDGDDD